jgi:hypothetical protein
MVVVNRDFTPDRVVGEMAMFSPTIVVRLLFGAGAAVCHVEAGR